jgi:hypothetical protein
MSQMGFDHSPLDFECPICGAPPGNKCATMSGNFCPETHIERVLIARNHTPKPPSAKALLAKQLPNR